ncbi:MAG: hypothetical protein ACYTEK_22440, partial [Planctomycetota bacterium]
YFSTTVFSHVQPVLELYNGTAGVSIGISTNQWVFWVFFQATSDSRLTLGITPSVLTTYLDLRVVLSCQFRDSVQSPVSTGTTGGYGIFCDATIDPECLQATKATPVAQPALSKAAQRNGLV